MRGVARFPTCTVIPGPGCVRWKRNASSCWENSAVSGCPFLDTRGRPRRTGDTCRSKTAQQLTNAYVDLLTRMRPLIGQGLSAAVYTQTTDVEVEVNGLMTYDREVNKVDLERAAEAARKLYLPPPKVQTLVPTSQVEPQSWQFTLQQPADDWVQPGFADADWQTGPGGFGTPGTPGAIVGTKWDSSDIWMRRTFTLGEIPTAGEVSLTIHHDEDVRCLHQRPTRHEAQRLQHQLCDGSVEPGGDQGVPTPA